ncbi:hypothetical protein BDW62DRAFT_97319 [Aspergillus aurantiobrunneus]
MRHKGPVLYHINWYSMSKLIYGFYFLVLTRCHCLRYWQAFLPNTLCSLDQQICDSSLSKATHHSLDLCYNQGYEQAALDVYLASFNNRQAPRLHILQHGQQVWPKGNRA